MQNKKEWWEEDLERIINDPSDDIYIGTLPIPRIKIIKQLIKTIIKKEREKTLQDIKTNNQ